jgi:hypothetical protein
VRTYADYRHTSESQQEANSSDDLEPCIDPRSSGHGSAPRASPGEGAVHAATLAGTLEGAGTSSCARGRVVSGRLARAPRFPAKAHVVLGNLSHNSCYPTNSPAKQTGTTCLDPYADKLSLPPGPTSGNQAGGQRTHGARWAGVRAEPGEDSTGRRRRNSVAGPRNIGASVSHVSLSGSGPFRGRRIHGLGPGRVSKPAGGRLDRQRVADRRPDHARRTYPRRDWWRSTRKHDGAIHTHDVRDRQTLSSGRGGAFNFLDGVRGFCQRGASESQRTSDGRSEWETITGWPRADHAPWNDRAAGSNRGQHGFLPLRRRREWQKCGGGRCIGGCDVTRDQYSVTPEQRLTTTSSAGRYGMCGVPQDIPLFVSISRGSRRGAETRRKLGHVGSIPSFAMHCVAELQENSASSARHPATR